MDTAAKVWIEGRIGGGYVVLRSTGALYPPQLGGGGPYEDGGSTGVDVAVVDEK